MLTSSSTILPTKESNELISEVKELYGYDLSEEHLKEIQLFQFFAFKNESIIKGKTFRFYKLFNFIYNPSKVAMKETYRNISNDDSIKDKKAARMRVKYVNIMLKKFYTGKLKLLPQLNKFDHVR